ncbi:hypothetical protein D1818_07670 [Aquimarina sp. BL5]|uniref:hypothetical protein n=1 Tax=Aquimarina sp. BL5 TaxID=1714860 RepID=UPI000E53ED1C|nr:hypothetical protein [Aquimarina sp. BL5]AXT50714.1 hypothetical protein D1818_07670 [Aquimarina sp. BL5]RKM99835.1 hypothetical protein D7036_19670 [Aquimarina sp. BL5]
MHKVLKIYWPVALSSLIFLIALLLNADNAFFWDTVQLGSHHADHYFKTNFSVLLLPDNIDSGHIPAFGAYIAMFWKFFGRSLWVSHLAMLPFGFGLIFQLFRLTKRFIDPKYWSIAFGLIIIDPSLMSQLLLVSPDVPLLFFFLLAVNSVLDNKKIFLMMAVVLLFLTSMRGMMLSVCILIFDLSCNVLWRIKIKELCIALLKGSLVYIPAFLVFITFSFIHFQEKGWIGFHQDSPWQESFEKVEFAGVIFNIAVLGWRILDFGRIGIWIVLFILFAKYRKQIIKVPRIRQVSFFFGCILFLLPLNMLWAKGLLGNRYLIPIYLFCSLLCATILFSDFVGQKLRIGLILTWAVILISGNFWIYPPKISQGWDATLAHLPYYNLRLKAKKYLDDQKIDFSRVASFFPNDAGIDAIELNGEKRSFTVFKGDNDFVFYSNIYNVSDQEYDDIISNYEVIQSFEKNGVFVWICKRKK